MYKTTFFLLGLIFCVVGCQPDDEPEASCFEGGVYKIAAISEVIIDSTVSNDTDNGTYWVCDGGKLTLSGTNNIILVDSGAVVVIDGKENLIYNLGGGLLTLNGRENEAWLNGESVTHINGFENLLYYYRVSQIFEHGNNTFVEELCGNVELDFSEAPEAGCRR